MKRAPSVVTVPLAVLLLIGLLAGCSGRPRQVVKVTQYNQGQGVPLFVSADAAKLAGAPKDFQEFMAAKVRSAIEFDDGSCDEPAVYSVTALADTGFAAGELSQCGVQNIVWARRANHWGQVWAGAGEPPCARLKKYAVPRGLAGQTCTEDGESKLYRG